MTYWWAMINGKPLMCATEEIAKKERDRYINDSKTPQCVKDCFNEVNSEIKKNNLHPTDNIIYDIKIKHLGKGLQNSLSFYPTIAKIESTSFVLLRL